VIELQANRAGIETVTENGQASGFSVAEAAASYLKDIEPPQREPKIYQAYKHCLELFANECAKKFVLDVKREDVLGFIRKLNELGCSPRTAYNRAVIVSQLLKANGITKILHNRDWPDYVDPIQLRTRRNPWDFEGLRWARADSVSDLPAHRSP
jgi:hypothetical protein